MSGSSYSDMDSYSTSESEVDIPIFFPVPFQELSSVQYHSLEEQLTDFAASLKNQFQRHCFIQIGRQETQPMLVPFVEPVTTFSYSRKNLDSYIQRQHEKQKGLSAEEVDRLLKEQETALLQTIAPPATVETPSQEPASPVTTPPQEPERQRRPIWAPSANSKSEIHSKPWSRTQQRKRGPKADLENHAKVAKIIRSYGDTWTADENLSDICESLDREEIPIPKTWPTRTPPSRSWRRALTNDATLVIKAIKDRCKGASANT